MSLEPGTDRWIKCISTHGNIRGVAIQVSRLAQEIADRHGLEGRGAQGLAEAVIGALCLASYCKPGERTNLNIQGDGYHQQALVDAYPDATLRGYVIERNLDVQQIKALEDSETGPWGTGVLSVLRSKGGEGKQPYIGTVPLLTGHLAKDLTFYWLQSEQLPSSVGIAVQMDESGRKVKSAGGFLVQALPGASPEEVRHIEKQIHSLGSLAEEMSRNEDPIHLLARIFENTAFMIMEEKPIQFECNCSWDRVERTLMLIGEDELRAFATQKEKPIVRCDFCSTEYELDTERLNKLISNYDQNE